MVFWLLLIIICSEPVSFAITERISINDDTYSFINKAEKIASNFDSNYEITNNNNKNNDEIKQNITELTKKTTYLLLGEANKEDEASEDYYKRYKDYLKLRYDPEVPKDSNSILGLDTNSQEYKDDLLSGVSVPGMFYELDELDIKYSSYGRIKVSVTDENNVISMITLSNVTMKEQDSQKPMNYNTIKTDLTMYYYFKKLNGEYKLLFLKGETDDDIEQYFEHSNEKVGELSKDDDYNTDLEDVYDFSKVKAISEKTLTKIYDENKNKIVFLNSTYATGTTTSANGFFINEGIIVTTYNYIEKSLIKAQNIIISDSIGNVYELDGIVTVNVDNDIAILKVNKKNEKYIKVENVEKPQKEDAVITLNSKDGIGLTTAKGIIISNNDDMQTSLPVTESMQGSPLFNSNGELIGMINSKSVNTSISTATEMNVLNEYYKKFSNIKYDEIKAISFETLKENYYIKYSEEKIINNIPQDKWEQYSKAESADDFIKLNLVKASYKDKIISLRYKNDVSNYVDTMQFAMEYRANLQNNGYKEKNISNSKVIYENEKYQIFIMSEFDYLIIVMVKL